MTKLAPVLLLLAAAAQPTPDLPLELVNGGLAFSGKYFLQARFDGHAERCQLDTGATDTDVTGPDFKAYKPVGQVGRKSASNQGEHTDEIQIGLVQLGTQQARGVRVARYAAKEACVVGADLVANRPFAFRSLPKPALSWRLPKLTQRGLRRYKGILAVPLTFEAKPAQALWDTGAGLTCVDPKLVRQHPTAFTFVQDLDQGKDGTGRPVVMKLYRLDKLTVGTQTFRNLSVLAIDLAVVHENLSKDVDFILGVNAIRQGNWAFDPAHGAWDLTRQLL